MTHKYTEEDISFLAAVMKDFPKYLTTLAQHGVFNFDTDAPVIDDLLSDKPKVTVERQYLPYVTAWVQWKLEYHSDKTILWQSDKLDSAKARLVDIATNPIAAHLRSMKTKLNKTSLQYDNGCRFLARGVASNAGKGLSVNYVVMDDINPETKVYKEFCQNIWPCLCCIGAKFITVLPG